MKILTISKILTEFIVAGYLSQLRVEYSSGSSFQLTISSLGITSRGLFITLSVSFTNKYGVFSNRKNRISKSACSLLDLGPQAMPEHETGTIRRRITYCPLEKYLESK